MNASIMRNDTGEDLKMHLFDAIQTRMPNLGILNCFIVMPIHSVPLCKTTI